MKIEIKKAALSLLALGVFSFSPAVLAGGPPSADIDWGTGAHNITGNNDIETTGSLVNAFNLGGSGVTDISVNGVTFQAFAFPTDVTTNTVTLGNYNFTENSDFLVSYGNLGSNAAPFTDLGFSYQTLLSTAGGSSFVDTLTLTLSGLTVGQQYVFQFFTSNSANLNSNYSGTHLSTTANAGLSIGLVDNTTDADGGLGQFAVGTFTATDPSQTIAFNGGSGFQVPTINAFQLRAVPEPSSIAMMLMGAAGLAALIRLRVRRSV